MPSANDPPQRSKHRAPRERSTKTLWKKAGIVVAIVIGCGLPLLGSSAVRFFLGYRQWVHGPVHAVVESIGMCAGLALATLLLLMHRQNGNAHHVWTACGLLGMGVLDGFHAATTPGNAFVWLRTLATLVGGVFFAAVWLPAPIGRRQWRTALPAMVFAVIVLVAIVSLLWGDALPTMVVDGALGHSPRVLNAVGGAAFLASAAWFSIRHRTSHSIDDFLFAAFTFLFGMAGLMFWNSELWDLEWWWWHFMRLVAYVLALAMTFVLYQRGQRQLERLNESLEEMVAERTARTHAILEAAVDSIITVDERGSIESLNRAGERLFGHSAAEAIGSNIKMLIPPRYRDQHDAAMQHYVTTGQKKIVGMGREVELEGLRKDGTTFPLELTLSEVALHDRRLITGFVRDISERKAAEAKSKVDERRLNAVMDAAEVGCWELDLKTDRAWRSVRHDRIFGHPSLLPEWSFEVFMRHVVPADCDSVRESFAAALASDSFQMECRIRWPDDSQHWISAKGRAFRDAQGQPIRIMGWFGTSTPANRWKRNCAGPSPPPNPRTRPRVSSWRT